ncbi:unnamed protein product [Amoebophrya sp. A25]|nr:unnamed protein product [Amoebophrya sp. A25]|eukprot:GSA25T00013380001.1
MTSVSTTISINMGPPAEAYSKGRLELIPPGVRPSRACYQLPRIDAAKGLSAYVGICNWYKDEGADRGLDSLTKIASASCADLAARYPTLAGRIRSGSDATVTSGQKYSLFSYVRRKLLKTENLELCVDPDNCGLGFLLFPDIDSKVINAQTLADPLDTRTGITRAEFLKATSSARDPGGFFPYQSADAVDRDDIPLTYVVLGKTKGFWGLTLLVNHYVSDGSSYFRLLKEFDDIFAAHKQRFLLAKQPKITSFANPKAHFFSCHPVGELVFSRVASSSISPPSRPFAALPEGLEPLADFALTQVRDPDKYRCVLLTLTDIELKAIKAEIGAVSTNDALFALATRVTGDATDFVCNNAIAFPMDARGVHPGLLGRMLGNGVTTVRANISDADPKLSSKTLAERPSDVIRTAVRSRPDDPLFWWSDFFKPLLFLALRDKVVLAHSSEASAWENHAKNKIAAADDGRGNFSSSLAAPLLQDGQKRKQDTSNKSVFAFVALFFRWLAALFARCCLPSKLPVTLQHVSWVKVQHFPRKMGPLVCQKPIQLDEDPKLILRKMHHHGSLFMQFDEKTFTFRFCHRHLVVSDLLRTVADIKSRSTKTDGGKSGMIAGKRWWVDIF